MFFFNFYIYFSCLKVVQSIVVQFINCQCLPKHNCSSSSTLCQAWMLITWEVLVFPTMQTAGDPSMQKLGENFNQIRIKLRRRKVSAAGHHVCRRARKCCRDRIQCRGCSGKNHVLHIFNFAFLIFSLFWCLLCAMMSENIRIVRGPIIHPPDCHLSDYPSHLLNHRHLKTAITTSNTRMWFPTFGNLILIYRVFFLTGTPLKVLIQKS